MATAAHGGLTIGGLADAAGVSVETIRYYERRGLIEQPPRPTEGYRRYGQRDLERIDFIRRAKKLGFTLAEVQDLIRSSAGAEMDHILAAARKKLAEAHQVQEEARCRQRMLSALISVCEDRGKDCLGLLVGSPDDKWEPAP